MNAVVVVLYRKDTHPIVITKEGAEYEAARFDLNWHNTVKKLGLKLHILPTLNFILFFLFQSVLFCYNSLVKRTYINFTIKILQLTSIIL